MLHRCDRGFLGQAEVDKDLKQIQPISLDHGDCAARTGILAMCGSDQDEELIHRFVKNGLLIRYPGQPERGYDNPAETSRDQLICWAAGVYAINTAWNSEIVLPLYAYSALGKINKDILGFDVKLFLYLAAG